MTRDEEWLLREKYGGEKGDAFFADCKRLACGEPLGYIIGFVPFLNCNIWLDSHPLIPRPETEYWVEKAIRAVQAYTNDAAASPPRLLDLCSGSGCIGVALAKHMPTANVDFAEIDAHHLPTIKKNLTENGINLNNTTIIQSDLFANITGQYNFILSNPPYIDPTLDRAETSVKEFEPHTALYGGYFGLEFITTIITKVSTHLTANGQLWIEHEPEQTTAIHTLSQQQGFSVTTHKDQYQTKRFSILVLQ